MFAWQLGLAQINQSLTNTKLLQVFEATKNPNNPCIRPPSFPSLRENYQIVSTHGIFWCPTNPGGNEHIYTAENEHWTRRKSFWHAKSQPKALITAFFFYCDLLPGHHRTSVNPWKPFVFWYQLSRGQTKISRIRTSKQTLPPHYLDRIFPFRPHFSGMSKPWICEEVCPSLTAQFLGWGPRVGKRRIADYFGHSY